MTSKSYQLVAEKSHFQKLLTNLESSGTSLTMMLHTPSLAIHVLPGTLQENKRISTKSQWSYKPQTPAQSLISLAKGILRRHRRLLLRSKLTCRGCSHRLVLLELPSMQTKYFNSYEAFVAWSGEHSSSIRSILWDPTSSESRSKALLQQAMQRSKTQ